MSIYDRRRREAEREKLEQARARFEAKIQKTGTLTLLALLGVLS